MKKLLLIPFFILSVLAFISCNKSIIFDETVGFANDNWSFEEKSQTFEIFLKSSETPYSIVLDLELTETLNVNMFYATFTIITPSGGKTTKSILFNFAHQDEHYVKNTSSKEKTYRLIVYPKRYFSETGTYSFEVNQFSNKADNYGIRALRMYIEQVKDN